ncbi:hypothetical protein M6B38_212830 [Iris pallida]|uniref:Uncharacterized protein n=1 Tax=Iris pallida TaxID=29817 RepID=A0AAX6E2L4_IRIPA|nr:hypothetical protein M6B38_212830 [Iris pallida]
MCVSECCCVRVDRIRCRGSLCKRLTGIRVGLGQIFSFNSS